MPQDHNSSPQEGVPIEGPARPSLGEPLSVFAAVAFATVGIELSGRFLGLSDYTQMALAALFLWVSVQRAQASPGGLRGHGLWLGGLLDSGPPGPTGAVAEIRELLTTLLRAVPSAARETGFALKVALVVFPPFVLGFYLFHDPSRPFRFLPPEAPLDQIAAQLLVIGLPEEAFFRGYLQTRLGFSLPRRWRLMGATVSPVALLLQAVLFALLHFAVQPYPARLAVFFPALLFGWMRDARGGIGAAFVFHALCNLLSDVLVRGFL